MRRKMSYRRRWASVEEKSAFSSSKPKGRKGRQLLFGKESWAINLCTTHSHCCLGPTMFWISRQSFSMQPWLTWISLCRPGYLRIPRLVWTRFLHPLSSPLWYPVFTHQLANFPSSFEPKPFAAVRLDLLLPTHTMEKSLCFPCLLSSCAQHFSSIIRPCWTASWPWLLGNH